MAKTIEIPDIEIPEEAIIDIPKGLTPDKNAFWLYLLNFFGDSPYAFVVDRRLVPKVQSSLEKRIVESVQKTIDDAGYLLSEKHGERRVKGWGTRWDRFLRGGVIQNAIPLLEYDKVGKWKVNWGRFNDSRPAHWNHGWALEDIHLGNEGKVFLLDVKYPGLPHQIEFQNVISRGMWRSSISGLAPYFLSQCDEEDLMLFYNAHWSWLELRRELIRRGANLDIPEHLKPEVKFSYIMDVRNTEWRRTVMQISDVQDYPEPIAEDEEGILYPLDNTAHVLKVTCPSTGRVYHLGVPSRFSTPKDARRWTLNLPPGVELVTES